jgi:CheY-like chemotaxis protein
VTGCGWETAIGKTTEVWIIFRDDGKLTRMSTENRAEPKKILIVEDETITLALTRRLLTEAGYQVVATEDGGAAVSLAMAEKPDLILLDLGLAPSDPFSGSNLDGFSIMDWMHRMMKDLPIPIIVVTAKTGPEMRAKVLEAGAVAYISKPADKQKLLTAIEIALTNG